MAGKTHVYLLTCCPGLEEALLIECAIKLHAKVLGPFRAVPLTAETLAQEDDSVLRGKRTTCPDRLEDCMDVQRAPQGQELALAYTGAESMRRVKQLSHELAMRLMREGVIVVSSEADPKTVAALMCAKGAYAYLGGVAMPRDMSREDMIESITLEVACSSSLDFDAVLDTWMASGYTEVSPALLQKQQAQGGGAGTADETEETGQEQDQWSTNAKKARVRHVHQISLQAAHAHVTQHGLARAACERGGVDLGPVPVVDFSGPMCRASVEKRRSRAWACKTQEIAGAIGHGLQLRFQWPVNLKAYHINVFSVMTEHPHAMFYGIALKTVENNNLVHRVSFGYSALQPHIAASLALLAGPQPGDLVLDPMCGCGTIPIECCVMHPEVLALGGDIDGEAVHVGGHNLELAVPKAAAARTQLHTWNSTCLPFGDASVDMIVCDMPWGQRCSTPAQNKKLYPKLFDEWLRVLRPLGRIVALALDRKLMSHICDKRRADMTLLSAHIVDIGHKVTLYTIERHDGST